MSWQPIDPFSPSAVDQSLIACDLDGSIRAMRLSLGADLRAEGRSAAIVDRILDVYEMKIRAFARTQAERTIASVRARLLRDAANEPPT